MEGEWRGLKGGWGNCEAAGVPRGGSCEKTSGLYEVPNWGLGQKIKTGDTLTIFQISPLPKNLD